TGIHSSISMCESDDGARTAATRQCAGSWAPAPRPLPAWAAPAGRNSAVVIVVCGRDSVFRPSHADCCCAIAAKKRNAKLVIMAGASVEEGISEIGFRSQNLRTGGPPGGNFEIGRIAG